MTDVILAVGCSRAEVEESRSSRPASGKRGEEFAQCQRRRKLSRSRLSSGFPEIPLSRNAARRRRPEECHSGNVLSTCAPVKYIFQEFLIEMLNWIQREREDSPTTVISRETYFQVVRGIIDREREEFCLRANRRKTYFQGNLFYECGTRPIEGNCIFEMYQAGSFRKWVFNILGTVDIVVRTYISKSIAGYVHCIIARALQIDFASLNLIGK